MNSTYRDMFLVDHESLVTFFYQDWPEDDLRYILRRLQAIDETIFGQGTKEHFDLINARQVAEMWIAPRYTSEEIFALLREEFPHKVSYETIHWDSIKFDEFTSWKKLKFGTYDNSAIIWPPRNRPTGWNTACFGYRRGTDYAYFLQSDYYFKDPSLAVEFKLRFG